MVTEHERRGDATKRSGGLRRGIGSVAICISASIPLETRNSRCSVKAIRFNVLRNRNLARRSSRHGYSDV